jgi:glucose/arabinose dehydrogenase
MPSRPHKILTLLLLTGSTLPLRAQVTTPSELKARVGEMILKSCAAGSCHNGFATPQLLSGPGEVAWATVQAQAPRLIARLQSSGQPMPPARVAASQQLSQEQKRDFVTYLQSIATQDPVGLPLSSLRLPPGFKIELFAKARGARSLVVSEQGVVFVGTGGFSDVDPEGRVYAIVPQAQGRTVVTLARGLNNPNGIALRGSDLYIAELTRITRIPNALEAAQSLAQGATVNIRQQVVRSGLPTQPTHSWKYLAFGPDDKLYTQIGAPCNVCDDDRENFAAIFRMNPDGTAWEQVAKGVRNTVGFDWHPRTGEFWFTDNGRDMLGNNTPPDELNRLTALGQDFGFPYCHGKSVVDPEFKSQLSCESGAYVKPVVELGAHVAALGMTFYRGQSFPSAYQQQIFIAEHGSWNRNPKGGYRVSWVQLQTDASGRESYSYQPFISGWLDEATQKVWGRPVDVRTYVDGSLLISDDRAGAVYRVTYGGE